MPLPPLIARLRAARRLAPVAPRYRIVYEDPAETDAPCRIVAPSPRWLACALAGGVLPPIETRLADIVARERSSGHRARAPYAAPIGPLTEEEAMEYLVQMVVPLRVWDGTCRGNRRLLAIVPAETIPTDRTFRDAWRLAQFGDSDHA